MIPVIYLRHRNQYLIGQLSLFQNLPLNDLKRFFSVKNMNYIPLCTLNSQSRLDDQVSHWQFEIINLHKFMYNPHTEFDQLKFVVDSAGNSPISVCQSSFILNYQQQPFDHNPAASQTHTRHHYETCTSIPIQSASSNQPHTLTSADQICYLQKALQQSNVALAHRDIELDNLRKEIDELRYSRSTFSKSPMNVLPWL
ncbi:unnamed protein product [Adineta steineri]|uniref:Uncharacterized protein n=1 Tax=Adineta steineri TaxID=433720 RepID=A0A815U5R0_9BILA|nr:unnamed protein product [Adineta steineri]